MGGGSGSSIWPAARHGFAPDLGRPRHELKTCALGCGFFAGRELSRFPQIRKRDAQSVHPHTRARIMRGKHGSRPQGRPQLGVSSGVGRHSRVGTYRKAL